MLINSKGLKMVREMRGYKYQSPKNEPKTPHSDHPVDWIRYKFGLTKKCTPPKESKK